VVDPLLEVGGGPGNVGGRSRWSRVDVEQYKLPAAVRISQMARGEASRVEAPSSIDQGAVDA
jgi:hypothetical protein